MRTLIIIVLVIFIAGYITVMVQHFENKNSIFISVTYRKSGLYLGLRDFF